MDGNEWLTGRDITTYGGGLVDIMSDNTQQQPLRILLAEDNDVNRHLVEALLKKKEMEVVSVRDGFQAIRVFDEDRFDVVLMDVQMPNLDGYAATEKIRDMEGDNGRHALIVAMTAHTHKDDRERCFKAGMDVYLPKPIKANQLYELIDNFMKRQLKVSSPADEDPVLDLDKALEMVDGDRELLGELARDFLGGAPRRFEELETIIRTGNSEQLERKAHSLKGDIGIFGAKNAFELADRLETLGRNGNHDGEEDLLVRLKEELYKLKMYFAGPEWKRNA